MVQSRIIIDTNVYFRLAQSIHPLLKTVFGSKNYCLFVLPEMYKEFKRNPRLKSMFPWVEDQEYAENRDCRLKTTEQQKKDISRTFDFMLAESQSQNLTASRVDIMCLAYGLVLKVLVVTDDTDMIQLGQMFGVEVVKLIDLLKLMLDQKHIDMNKIEEIAQYLQYTQDLPKNFKHDYKKVFGSDPPVCSR